jgi:hypothetical protein
MGIEAVGSNELTGNWSPGRGEEEDIDTDKGHKSLLCRHVS